MLLATLGVALTTSCRDAALAFGPSAPVAAPHADLLFGAFANRYAEVIRDAKYERARARLASDALVPSRLFGDTSLWSVALPPALRLLWIQGSSSDGRHHLDARSSEPPRPAHPGDGRHLVALTRLSDDQYVWDTSVEFAVGSITADDAGSLTASLLGAPERRSEAEVRADVRAAFPRSAAALGRYMSIDTIRSLTAADASTATTVVFGTDPGRLARTYPALGAYMAKYANPARMTVEVSDATGIPWMTIVARDGRLAIRYRSLRGRLLPLYGPPRHLPDTLRVTADLTMKVKIFTVGVRHLVMDLAVTEQPHERGWTFIARREPDWVLPLITEHLIRSSLRRPFAGGGATFRLALRDTVGATSLLERRTHLAVQEGPILRFLSGLSGHAVNEFDARAEHEQERFLHDVFVALQADTRALLGGRAKGDLD